MRHFQQNWRLQPYYEMLKCWIDINRTPLPCEDCYPVKPARSPRFQKRKVTKKVAKRDPICIDGVRPRPMFVDYKDLDMLSKLTNRHGRIVSRRKTGCQATSQHAVSKAVKRARFMALMPYVGN